MYWLSACSCSGERRNCRSMCSSRKFSGTGPRSFFAVASGRVPPVSIASLDSSMAEVMRGPTFCALAIGTRPASKLNRTKPFSVVDRRIRIAISVRESSSASSKSTASDFQI